MSHASIPAEKRTLPGDLIRLSIGIEDADDLICDLEHAIKVASHEVAKKEDDKFDSEFNDLPRFPGPFSSPRSRPGKDGEMSTVVETTNSRLSGLSEDGTPCREVEAIQ